MAKKTKAPEPAAETPAGEVAVATTKSEIVYAPSDVEQRWASMIEDLKRRKYEAASGVLQYRYDVGKLAIQLSEDKSRELEGRMYGSHTTADICVALGESNSQLSGSVKFVRYCDERELDSLKQHQLPWRAVAALISVNDRKKYESLKKKFIEGKIEKSDELRKLVKEVNAGEKASGVKKRGGGTSMATTFKALVTNLEQATSERVPNVIKALRDYAKAAQEMSSDGVATCNEALKQARKLSTIMRKLLDKLDEAIDNV